MKGTLSFDLPEENEDFEIARNGWKYHGALQDMDNWLRGKLKYGDHDEATQKLYQECRDKLHEICSEFPLW